MSEIETWKDVPGYEGIYQVSDLGQIKRVGGWTDGRRIRTRRMRRFDLSDNGYLRITLHRDRRKLRLPVHLVVLSAFVGPLPFGYQGNHKNGIRSDNRLENLEYVTPSQNHQHSLKVLGRELPHGTDHWGAKLTVADVLEIRRLRKSGVMAKDIAPRFGIADSAVSTISRGVAWKHVRCYWCHDIYGPFVDLFDPLKAKTMPACEKCANVARESFAKTPDEATRMMGS
jgi:hypothetical protein